MSIFVSYITSKGDQLKLFKYNLNHIPLFQISIGFTLGTISGSVFPVFILALILLFPIRRSKVLLYVAFGIGLINLSFWQSSMTKEAELVQKDLTTSAYITQIEKGEFTSEITLNIRGFNGLALAKTTDQSIDLYDEVEIKGKLFYPKEIEEFDYPSYLKSNKIFYEYMGEIKLVSKTTDFRTVLRDIKYNLVRTSSSNLPKVNANLLNGILLGDTSGLTEDTSNAFRKTGTSHILSVSGFNFSIILIFLLSFSALIGRNKLSILSIPIIIGFLFLVGVNNLTAVRATIMILIYIFVRLLGRRMNFIYLVSLTMFIFLHDYPLSYTNLSLQLSFGSLLGLHFLSGTFKKFFAKLPEIFKEGLSTTLAAVTGTLPFTIVNFKSISLIAPIVNVLVLPLIPFIMLFGFLAQIFSLINLRLISQILFKITDLLLSILTEVIYQSSALSFADTTDSIVIFLFIAILLMIILYSDFQKFYKKHY